MGNDKDKHHHYRLICNDACIQDSHERLMSNQQASMIFTDPPYNVPISWHVSGLGSLRREDFVMASGEMSQEEYDLLIRHIFLPSNLKN